MIPTALLPQNVTIEAYEGTTGNGAPSFAPPVVVDGRRDAKRTVIRRADGTNVIAESTVIIRPRVVPTESRVTIGGRTFTVVGIVDRDELNRPHSTELAVVGPIPDLAAEAPLDEIVLDGGTATNETDGLVLDGGSA